MELRCCALWGRKFQTRHRRQKGRRVRVTVNMGGRGYVQNTIQHKDDYPCPKASRVEQLI